MKTLIFSKDVCLAWIAGAGFSPDAMREILQEEADPIRMLHSFRENGHLIPEDSLPQSIAAQLRKSSREEALTHTAELMQAHHIHAMTFLDDCYPDRLRDLPDSPAILFDQGNRNASAERTVSIVGSRSASYKGLEATRKLSEQLSLKGITVISGLAYGIDAAAHQGCLRGGAPTVAVLGCGLDQDYPRENAALRQEILRNGGQILSEFVPGEKPLGWHFPWRNRIISGMGDALIVMEARIRSGSMTTVQHALNQGKEVFVYPGEPGSIKSEGNHQLLREGAVYFVFAEDILEDMGWLDRKEQLAQNKERSVSTAPAGLSPEELAVLQRLEGGELSFDQLCASVKIQAAQLSAVLSMLQIQGMIEPLPGKLFRRTDQQ